jgi:hypothetical protein
MPKATVSKVRFQTPSGRFAGIGTRVVLEDGYTATFVGPPASKARAIQNAEYQRSKGLPSETLAITSGWTLADPASSVAYAKKTRKKTGAPPSPLGM